MVFILKIIILNNHNANKFYFISYLHDFQFLYRQKSATAISGPAHLVSHKGMCQNHQKCLKQCLDQTSAINSGVERESSQLEITMGQILADVQLHLLPTLQQTQSAVGVVYTHLFKVVFEFVCTASCANSQRCYHSSTAIAVGMPYFMGCISVQYFLFAWLHKQNVNHVVRTGQKITCSYQCSSSGKKSILICRKALTLLT